MPKSKTPMELHLHKNAFHEWLGKSPDEPITMSDIKIGLRSDDPHVRKMAGFAKNARNWNHAAIAQLELRILKRLDDNL